MLGSCCFTLMLSCYLLLLLLQLLLLVAVFNRSVFLSYSMLGLIH